MQIELTLEEIRSILAECSNCDLTARLEKIYEENKPVYPLNNAEALIALGNGKTVACESEGYILHYKLVNNELRESWDTPDDFVPTDSLMLEKEDKWRIVE